MAHPLRFLQRVGITRCREPERPTLSQKARKDGSHGLGVKQSTFWDGKVRAAEKTFASRPAIFSNMRQYP
jgi:hypothetical protein